MPMSSQNSWNARWFIARSRPCPLACRSNMNCTWWRRCSPGTPSNGLWCRVCRRLHPKGSVFAAIAPKGRRTPLADRYHGAAAPMPLAQATTVGMAVRTTNARPAELKLPRSRENRAARPPIPSICAPVCAAAILESAPPIASNGAAPDVATARQQQQPTRPRILQFIHSYFTDHTSIH